MQVFDDVYKYTKQANKGDIIVFGGKGIVNGLCMIESKHDTYKVAEVTNDRLIVKNYRGKKKLKLSPNSFDQKIALLSKKEFDLLLVLW